ncbi:hypothetical protein SMICM304S_00450 [Streptomyces microflavus]
MSHLGRSVSLSPPTRVTTSACIAAAGRACSSTIWLMSLPRTARLAYRKLGDRAASREARTSAHPR